MMVDMVDMVIRTRLDTDTRRPGAGRA